MWARIMQISIYYKTFQGPEKYCFYLLTVRKINSVKKYINIFIFYIWDKMCWKNSDKIHVLFSPPLWLQSALLCLPGSLELVCSWIATQYESPHVTSWAKSKYPLILRHLKKTLNVHCSSTVRDFETNSLKSNQKFQKKKKFHHQLFFL